MVKNRFNIEYNHSSSHCLGSFFRTESIKISFVHLQSTINYFIDRMLNTIYESSLLKEYDCLEYLPRMSKENSLN